MTEIVKKGSDLFKETLLRKGIVKIDGQKVTKDIEVRKLIDSGLVTVSSLANLPDVLLVFTAPDEEVYILKKVYKKGEICVSVVIGKIKLSRIKKWIESGLVGLEKREGMLLLTRN